MSTRQSDGAARLWRRLAVTALLGASGLAQAQVTTIVPGRAGNAFAVYQDNIYWTEPEGEFSYPTDKYWYVPVTGGTPALLDPTNNPVGDCCVGIARPSGAYIYSLSPSRIARLF